ncbi:MAG: hypothetical protein AAF487_15035 [Bacteroidota bacterium]
MATKEEAIRITQKFISESPIYSKYKVGEDKIKEYETVWYVPFFEIIPDSDSYLVGSYNGLIVDKNTMDFMQPGSGLKLEEWIYGFKIGLRGENYDLIIKKVNDLRETKEILPKLGMTYVKLEFENGIEWKIPQNFTRKEINNRLKKLPCVFKNQKFTFSMDIFREIKRRNLFIYELKSSESDPKILGELIEE